MIPKGVRGNKRSRTEILKVENKIRVLLYSENPRYTDEGEHMIDTNPRFGEKTNQRENRKGLKK
jgi:hypothetical protein